MSRLQSWWVLGRHRVGHAPGTSGAPTFDGVDLALRLDDGSVRAFGLRTPERFLADASGAGDGWDDGYTPIRTDLDPTSVEYWSFDRLLWLGPEPRPCVIWTNAVGLTDAGVDRLLTGERVAVLLAGRDGTGLPRLETVVAATG